jgi:large subunit ribosomal protein L3
MSKAHNPRRGSMQFWPRKRSRHSFVRVRSWAKQAKVKPLGFIAYKAGMTHTMVVDNRAKSLTKGEKISLPVTIFDCPPMYVLGVVSYKKDIDGAQKINTILASNISKDLKKDLDKKISLPKKAKHSLDNLSDFTFLRLLVSSRPSMTTTGRKKPEVIEIALGGKGDEQLVYAKEVLGKEINMEDVFQKGALIDAHGVTKGKGFQGVVKRYGVNMVSHKSEKGQRKIANMGAWTPKRVDYRVAQPGKMGYHLRTEYNKQIIDQGNEVEKVNRKQGLHKYGLVKTFYTLIRGSVPGPVKGTILLTEAIRPTKKIFKEAPEVTFISQ